MKDINERIKEFLAQNFPNVELEDEQDIFELEIVNSLFAMQLVLFLEKEFDVNLENEDLELDNFKSIKSMTCLIEKKQGFEMSGGIA